MKDQEIGKEIVGELPLFQFLGERIDLPNTNLLALTGDATLAEPTFKSGLTERIAKAWITPLPELTGKQVRVLVGQMLGLPWLAKPVAMFLHQHPRAECDLYPGDLMSAALRAHQHFSRFAPTEMQAVLSGDFGWMTEEFAFDRDGLLLREAMDDLTSARGAAGLI